MKKKVLFLLRKNSKNVSKQNQEEAVLRESKEKYFTKTRSNKAKIFQEESGSLEKR